MNKNILISTYEENNLLFKSTTTALLEDNFLTYNTDNDNIKINLHNFSFTKDNYESTLKITNNKCYLFIKSINKTLEIPLEYLEFNYENNKVYLNYKLASNEHNIKIVI